MSHVLAGKLLHLKRQDLPESGAWGMSPAEQYLGRQLGRRQEPSHVSLTPREVLPIPFD